MKSLSQKIISLLVLAVFTFNIAAPAVNAQIGPVPVSDGAIRSKEVGLTVFGVTLKGITFDSVMIAISKKLLERMSDDVVQWINNGFDGGSAFATDPGAYFLEIGDSLAGQFIDEIGAGALCSPFKAQIQGALRISYNSSRVDPRERYAGSCTLSGIAGNIQGFFDGDFSQGGWEGWFSVTQNQNNNPYGAMIVAQSELAARIASASGVASKELDWAKGFLSSRDCLQYKSVLDPDQSKATDLDGNGKIDPDEQMMKNGKCVEQGPVKTPGSVIENQLQKVLGSEISQLELADEFDEIVSALVGQLMGVVFNSGKGLIAENQPRWSAGGYGGNGTQKGTYQCAPSIDVITLKDGEAAVTWKVYNNNGSTVSNASYLWTGDAPISGSGEEKKVIYTTGGVKAASVTVTETLMASGTASTVTLAPIDCQPVVEVKKYDPISGFCFAIDVSTYNQSLSVNEFRKLKINALRQSQQGHTPESVAWVVFPSGGSGVYDDFLWNIAGIGKDKISINVGGAQNMRGFFENKIITTRLAPKIEILGPDDTGEFILQNILRSIPPFFGQDSRPIVAPHSILPVGFYFGDGPNPRTASVKIYDKEFNEVEGATINCSDIDVI